jgi:hypothetical protein
MTAAAPPDHPGPPTLYPLPDPRAMPTAYMVRTTGVQPALFTDMGRALAYAAQYRGELVPLYERGHAV